MSAPYDLNRFIDAQASHYETAYHELQQGHKQSHWMWYIFPQYEGLGYTQRSQFYAIKSKTEAIAYLNHPILGKRLQECCQLLLEIKNRSIHQILGFPDDLKLKSSMTLFERISDEAIFGEVLERYFEGERDERTVGFLS